MSMQRPNGKSRNALVAPITQVAPGVAIYMVGASPFWQARVRIFKQGRYVVRSTRETAKIEARQAAIQLSISLNQGVATVPSQFTFASYADKLVDQSQRRVRDGKLNANYARTMEGFLNNKDWGLTPHFGDRDIRKLQTRDYIEFMNRLSQRHPDFSSSFRNMVTATFRNVLKLARNDGIIAAIPDTPRDKQKDQPRVFFNFAPLVPREEDEYQKLREVAKRLSSEGRIVRGVPLTDELHDIILFCVHSFIRPNTSELYALRRRDVVRVENPLSLQLTVRKGKTGFRIANTTEGAVAVLKRILLRYPDAGPDNYFFLPMYANRATASRIIQRQFNVVLEVSGLKHDPATGSARSLYCLRHNSICMRIVNSGGKVNIYSLAKNAGTSVAQIERFYAKFLPLSGSLVRNLQVFE